jgi:mRNA interferase RelE/StbE
VKTYEITWTKKALKALDDLDATMAQRILIDIHDLSNNPRPPGCVKMSGCADTWRIKTGKYRVLYNIKDRELTILIIDLGHRREVYR